MGLAAGAAGAIGCDSDNCSGLAIARDQRRHAGKKGDEGHDLLHEEGDAHGGDEQRALHRVFRQVRRARGKLGEVDQEYILLIDCDTNTNGHCQWYYFAAMNGKAPIPVILVLYRYRELPCFPFHLAYSSF